MDMDTQRNQHVESFAGDDGLFYHRRLGADDQEISRGWIGYKRQSEADQAAREAYPDLFEDPDEGKGRE